MNLTVFKIYFKFAKSLLFLPLHLIVSLLPNLFGVGLSVLVRENSSQLGAVDTTRFTLLKLHAVLPTI